ncbi:MAG: glycoside hydrolase family 15 protein [Acidocella sp.]|nr:glycoside hydrolase family 15 protein [Acidocella sp.]
MGLRIEDYAVIGNCETMAVVGRDGSIDWLCLPRFDSAACFAALLGDDKNGHWRITPSEAVTATTRRYRDGTLILETSFETATGAVMVIDVMTRRSGGSEVLRRVRGLRGTVSMDADLVVRFDYGAAVPWVLRLPDARTQFVVGPDRLLLQSTISHESRDMRTQAHFVVAAGQEVDFALGWSPSYDETPPPLDIGAALSAEDTAWRDWSGRFPGLGEYSDIVLRSLITLKALTHFKTGGIVAAATTSLPEQLGGARNWDYRYCWLRDATLTLYALLESGYVDEAAAWQQWLVRAVAGSPAQVQIMYGIAGERRLEEWTIPWLPGYEASAPVHIGNAASGQIQLDVYGEVMDALYYGRTKGLIADDTLWGLQTALIAHLREIWDQPDDGLWEVRGGRRQFTHSKIMAWVAADRAIRSAEEFGLPAPLDEWRVWRDEIHAQVCAQGYNPEIGAFVQSYGAQTLDASLLMIALVGFLPVTDPRVAGTIAAIERDLLRDGFVIRYDTGASADGLPPGEGAFLACSFWLADNYVLQGRLDEARKLFDGLCALANDVGLLAEEYDPVHRRLVGNFPQAFSHIALVNTAFNISRAHGPARERAKHTQAVQEPQNG